MQYVGQTGPITVFKFLPFSAELDTSFAFFSMSLHVVMSVCIQIAVIGDFNKCSGILLRSATQHSQ